MQKLAMKNCLWFWYHLLQLVTFLLFQSHWFSGVQFDLDIFPTDNTQVRASRAETPSNRTIESCMAWKPAAGKDWELPFSFTRDDRVCCWKNLLIVRQETAELLQMTRCVSEFCCFVSVEIWTFFNTARASQTKSRNPNNWTSRLRHGKPAAGIEALRTTTAWLGMTGYVDVAGRIWWFARQETGHKQLLVLSVNSVHWVTL